MNSLINNPIRRSPITQTSARRSELGPIIVAEIYLSLTVFFCAFGPWPWPIHNPVTLYSYLVLAQLALLTGYLTAPRTHGLDRMYIGKHSLLTVLKFSIVLNLVWIVPYFYVQVGSDALSLQGILSHVIAGITSPIQVYKEKLAANSVRGNVLLYLYMLCSPILWLAVPLGLAHWNAISFRMKLALGMIVLGNAATWLALGTMKGIADSAAIIAISIAASRRRTFPPAHPKANSLFVKRGVVLFCAAAAAVAYFGYQHSSRQSGRLTLHDRDAGIDLDTDNIFIAGMPVPAQIAISSGIAYSTQGYYGLSLALEQPFEWSYGIGHSIALTSVFNKITGFDAGQVTYPAREQDSGWDMWRRFDSIYPWLASDVTFPGALVVIFLFGRLLAATWADAQAGDNPYALPLFVMVMIIILYFPANNQFLSASITVVAFWGLLLLWLSTRGKYRESNVLT